MICERVGGGKSEVSFWLYTNSGCSICSGIEEGCMGISMGKRAPNSMNTTGDDNDSIYIYIFINSANDDGREKPVHHNKKKSRVRFLSSFAQHSKIIRIDKENEMNVYTLFDECVCSSCLYIYICHFMAFICIWANGIWVSNQYIYELVVRRRCDDCVEISGWHVNIREKKRKKKHY